MVVFRLLVFLFFSRLIGHLPFGAGQVIALDVFDVDIVVFVLQLALVGRRDTVLAGPFGPFDFVGFRVFGQVIRAHETLAADRASESFLAGMRPQMALKFVGPGETLAAE